MASLLHSLASAVANSTESLAANATAQATSTAMANPTVQATATPILQATSLPDPVSGIGVATANATTFMPGESGFGWGGYFQAIGAILMILGLVYLGFWLLKRYTGRGGYGAFGRGQMKLESHLALGPKRSVVVVRFLNKRLVLGVTDASINLLTELDATDEPDSKSFPRHLERDQKGQETDDSS